MKSSGVVCASTVLLRCYDALLAARCVVHEHEVTRAHLSRQRKLGVDGAVTGSYRGRTVTASCAQLARLDIVCKVQAQNLEQATPQTSVLQRHHYLDAPIEISRHQVRAADVHLVVPAVSE